MLRTCTALLCFAHCTLLCTMLYFSLCYIRAQHYCVLCYTAGYVAYMHSTIVLVPTVHKLAQHYCACRTPLCSMLYCRLCSIHAPGYCVLCYTAAYAAYVHSTTLPVPSVHYCIASRPPTLCGNRVLNIKHTPEGVEPAT